MITSNVSLCNYFTICHHSSLVTQCKICLVSCFPVGRLPSPVSFFLLKQRICYDQFVFLCKLNQAISSAIFLPYSKCSHAFEVFFFCFSSNFCIEIFCNNVIFGVTISHCSFNIIIKLFLFLSSALGVSV